MPDTPITIAQDPVKLRLKELKAKIAHSALKVKGNLTAVEIEEALDLILAHLEIK